MTNRDQCTFDAKIRTISFGKLIMKEKKEKCHQHVLRKRERDNLRMLSLTIALNCANNDENLRTRQAFY